MLPRLLPHDRLPPDQAVRDRICGYRLDRGVVADLDMNAAVVAAAGSGKTAVLVGRLLAHVLAGTPPRTLAAITFTRKATAELKERFASDLQDLLANLDAACAEPHDPATARRLATERDRVDHALRHLDEVFIGTIHGFCRELLEACPAETAILGLDPGFRLLQEWEEAPLRRRFWRTWLADRVSQEPDLLQAVEALGLEPIELEPYFARLCEAEDVLPEADEVPAPDLTPAVVAVTTFVERWQLRRPERRLGRPLAEKRDELQKALDRAEALLHDGLPTEPAAQVRLLACFEGLLQRGTARNAPPLQGKVTLSAWYRTTGRGARTVASQEAKLAEAEFAKEVYALRDEELPHLVLRHVAPALRAWRAYAYGRLLRLCGPAVRAFAAQRKAAGKLTRQDLLLRAAELLRHPKAGPPARRRLAERFRHLLIDEFQDTDPIQAEVAFLLAADDPHASDWRTCRPRAGSLFVVGDDKQAIYRFRRADIAIFHEVCARLHPDGEPLRLDTNFRARRALCAWVNDALAEAFERNRNTDGGADRQAPYVPLNAYDVAEEDRPRTFVLTVPTVEKHAAATIAELEAERIAAFVATACREGSVLLDGEPARPEDFLILARTRKRLGVYAQALERLGVPYRVWGTRALGASEELAAVTRLLETLLDPFDGAARAAYLTGPFCGLGLDALVRYRLAGERLDGEPPADLPEAVRDRLPENDAEAFAQAWALLHRTRDLLETHRPATALTLLLEETGYPAFAAAADRGSARAGTLLKLIEIAQEVEAQGGAWVDVLETFRRYERGELEAEEGTLDAGQDGAVRIMNVHQAKGLQARVVFLADPYGKSETGGPEHHVVRAPHPRAVFPFYRNRQLLAAPDDWDDPRAAVDEQAARQTVRYDARRHEEAEALRLVYVACTRARELLVVGRYEPWHRLSPNSQPWSALAKALGQLDELPVPENPPASVPEPPGSLPEPAGVGAFAPLAAASFATGSPSGDRDEADDERPFLEVLPGRGRDFGSAVHDLLQDAVRLRHRPADPEADRRRVAAALARRGLRAPHFEEDALEALVRFRAGPIWRELLAAEDVRAEVPLAALADDPETPVVESGRVDLAFRDARGWHLVDYKTDVAPLERLERRYAAQLEAYRALWTRCTGTPPASVRLWKALP